MRYPSPRIYLDSAAAARPNPLLAQWYAELLPVCGVNPHGGTCFAEQARRIALEAARRLLRLLRIPEGEAEVIWTSGVTEALNLASSLAQGAFLLDPTAHAALREPILRTARQVAYPGVDRTGRLLSPKGAADGMAIGHVNNETGVRQELCPLREALGRNAIMILDCAQSFCKAEIPWEAAGVDAMALSSRKIGGPASVGALVVRRSRLGQMRAEIIGGGQQGGLRSGTLDVCGVEMFARAAEHAFSRMAEHRRRMLELNGLYAELLKSFAAKWKAVPVGEPPEDAAIHMLHIPGREGAVLSRILADEHGILVASSSACSAEHGQGSLSMRAMGFSAQAAKEALRVSFDAEDNGDELREFFAALDAVLEGF